MILRSIKLVIAIILSLIFTVSLARLVISLWNNLNVLANERAEVEQWLEQNQLGQHKALFLEQGMYVERVIFISLTWPQSMGSQ